MLSKTLKYGRRNFKKKKEEREGGYKEGLIVPRKVLC
jgi:hypothetical protein